MTSYDDLQNEKVPRRRFLKWTGAVAVAGLAAAGLGYEAGTASKQESTRTSTTSTSPTSRTATSAAPTSAATVTQTVTDATTQTVTESATASTTASAAVPANSFSIFWITDTQFLSETNPALFRMTTNWIVSNWSAYNGKLVIHTGDIVQNGNQQVEWQNAHEAMSILSTNGIPYSWCAGNHDDLVSGDPTSGWMGNQWAPAFDPSTVKPTLNALKYVSWADDYHNGMNTAVTFSANGLNFLVINVEWNGDPTVVSWVGNMLSNPAYADYNVIVAPHAYMDAYGLTNDPRWGPTLADFVGGLTPLLDLPNSNVFLTLNGHFATDEGYNTPYPLNSRNQLMFDRQDCRDAPNSLSGRGVDDSTSDTPDSDRVGGATVTILTFDTDHEQVSVKTYDVYTGKWRTDSNEQYSFAMFP